MAGAGWRLVGRAEELASVLAWGAGPDPGAVVVAGAAGVGKTRLATEAQRALEAAGYTTARAVASRAAVSIPFGALAPLLPRSGSLVDGRLDLLRQAAGWLGERAGPIPERVPGPAANTDRRLILFVDDAHLLDDGSAALLAQLAGEAWCRLVVTVRSGEPAPDQVTALVKDAAGERLALEPISAAEAEEFIIAVLAATAGQQGPVDGAAVRRIWDASGGNPLYLRELVLGARHAGALALDSGVWRLVAKLPSPPRLVELVGTRLDGVGDDSRRVLEYLAVAELLGLALLQQIVGANAVDELRIRGLIDVSADGRREQVRLAHPLYGEVLRSRLPVVASRRIRRTLADAISAAGARRREDVLQVATWQLDTGTAPDSGLLLEAARQAQRVFDVDLTERLARTSWQSGGGVAAGVVLSEAFFELGRHVEAEELLAQLSDEAGSDEERAKVANARAHNLSNYLDRQDDAAAVVAAAMRAVADPKLQEMLASRLAVLHLFNGRPALALQAAEPLLASEDTTAVLRSAYVAGIACAELGAGERAVAIATAAHDQHAAHPDASPQPPEVQHIGAVMAHIEMGRLAEASSIAAAGYRVMVDAGQREGQATFAMLEGLVGLAIGDVFRADRSFREGVGVNREIHDDLAMRWCLAGTAIAAGMAGDAAAAGDSLAELDALPAVSAQLMAIELQGRAHAWAAVARGEISAARAQLVALADRADAVAQRSVAIVCLHEAVRLGEHALHSRLRALASVVDGGLAPARAEHAEALAAQDARALDAVAVRFESMGALLLAAEASIEAARLYRARRLATASTVAERRADTLLARCPGARTPVVAGAVAAGDVLTAREREIAIMAAAGSTSKDIAVRLGVSARTVDNHLQRVYAKLGVSGREELALVL